MTNNETKNNISAMVELIRKIADNSVEIARGLLAIVDSDDYGTLKSGSDKVLSKVQNAHIELEEVVFLINPKKWVDKHPDPTNINIETDKKDEKDVLKDDKDDDKDNEKQQQ